MNELWSECKFLIVTDLGFRTSALAAVLFHITRKKLSYDKLVCEIRSAFYTADEIRSGPQMAYCQYSTAYILEGLRMPPPVGGFLWRKVEEPGILIQGEYISASHDVGVGIYAIHHDAKTFDEPQCFRPERWLQEVESGKKPASQAFAAFPMGPRACLGRNLAMMELCNIIAILLVWHLDLRNPDDPRREMAKTGETSAAVSEIEPTSEFQQEDHIGSFFKEPSRSNPCPTPKPPQRRIFENFYKTQIFLLYNEYVL